MPYDYVLGPLKRAPGSRSSKGRNLKKLLFLVTVLKYEDKDPGAVQLRPRGVDTFRYRKGICSVDTSAAQAPVVQVCLGTAQAHVV
jgi:hypothetical protein